MAQPMEKNCPVLSEAIQRAAHIHTAKWKGQHKSFGFNNPISIILTGLI
jgi:hypothetical protein